MRWSVTKIFWIVQCLIANESPYKTTYQYQVGLLKPLIVVGNLERTIVDWSSSFSLQFWIVSLTWAKRGTIFSCIPNELRICGSVEVSFVMKRAHSLVRYRNSWFRTETASYHKRAPRAVLNLPIFPAPTPFLAENSFTVSVTFAPSKISNAQLNNSGRSTGKTEWLWLL